jgi:hypothetical protein
MNGRLRNIEENPENLCELVQLLSQELYLIYSGCERPELRRSKES